MAEQWEWLADTANGSWLLPSPMREQCFRPNPVDAQVGNSVGLKRISLGLNQSYFAEKLGLTLDEYRDCESGMHRFGAECLLKLARLMDVYPQYFFQLSPVGSLSRNEFLN